MFCLVLFLNPPPLPSPTSVALSVLSPAAPMSDEEKLNFRILYIQIVIQLLQNRSVLQASAMGFCFLIGRPAGMCPEY
jgi:hypothetical protein